MIIKQVEDKEGKDRCPKCKSEVPPRHQALGYCPKCYCDLTSDDNDRRVRFHVL